MVMIESEEDGDAAGGGGGGASSSSSSTTSETSTSIGLDVIPLAILHSILSKLDVVSLCSAAAACRAFRSSVAQTLSFLPAFHLPDVAPTMEMIPPLLPPNPFLRSLILDCSRLDDTAIPHFLSTSLHELCLQNCGNFSSKLLADIGRYCGDLRSLTVGMLAERCDSLIQCSDLEQLLLGCVALESLSLLLDSSTFVGPNFPHVWSLASEKLVALEIGFILSQMVKEFLSLNLEAPCLSRRIRPPIFPSLQKLSLTVDIITDSLVATIASGLTSLVHLDLHDAPLIEPNGIFDLTNFGMQQINQHGKLKHLSLVRRQENLPTYFSRVNDLGILLMAETCLQLESIYLGGFCRITDAGFRAILHSCPKLHKLKVCHGIQLTDLVFHDISATSLGLTYVGLRSCKFLTDLSIQRLVSNKDLMVLDLRGCRSIGDHSLRVIADLSKLKSLLLDGSYITDSGLSHIGYGKAALVSLSLRGCQRLTDKCILSIFSSALSNSVQDLDLSNIPNLSDEGILSLVKTGVMLSELRIRECPYIGDISVMALASMRCEGGRPESSLRLLDLYNSGRMTNLAIKWLKKPYFPKLRWLGVTGSINRDLVDSLAMNRPFLHVACGGDELGAGRWDSFNNTHGIEYEEVDELEQWLFEGEFEEFEDEEMEEDLMIID